MLENLSRKKRMGVVGLGAISFLMVLPVFQNCAKAKYETTGSTQNGLALASRKAVIDPSFSNAPVDVKILIVVDDSFTMSNSQSYLSASLDTLFTNLQGRDAKLKLVSTSGTPNNAIDYNSTTKYMNELNQQITYAQAQLANSYLVEKDFSNANNRGEFTLSKNATPSEIDALKLSVKNAILNVGVNGSDQEEGLCAVARQLYDDAASSFFKAGDKGAVVIISDEDDSSVASNCTYRTVNRVNHQSTVYYHYNQQRARLSLQVSKTNDGIPVWISTDWSVPLSGTQTIAPGAACSGTHQTFAQNYITNMGYQIQNVTGCTYEVEPSAFPGADLGDSTASSGLNLCSGTFVHNNVSYNGLYSFVDQTGYSSQAGSCSRQVVASNTPQPVVENDVVFKSDTAAFSSGNISLAIYNRAVSLFGASSFFIANIINRPGQSCALGPAQSYGHAYLALANYFATTSSSTSICSNNYSASLSALTQMVVNVANKSYTTAVTGSEFISSVVVLRGGQSIRLNSQQYDAAGGTVTITNYTLLPGDKLEVYISNQ